VPDLKVLKLSTLDKIRLAVQIIMALQSDFGSSVKIHVADFIETRHIPTKLHGVTCHNRMKHIYFFSWWHGLLLLSSLIYSPYPRVEGQILLLPSSRRLYSSVGTVTGLHAGQPRIHGWIPGKGNGFLAHGIFYGFGDGTTPSVGRDIGRPFSRV
jgi:hypothetical protein